MKFVFKNIFWLSLDHVHKYTIQNEIKFSSLKYIYFLIDIDIDIV